MATFLSDDILDAAATYVSTYTETLYITNALATTFQEASTTYKMGSKSSPAFTGPADGDVSGRKITVDAITDGVVDATGNASHYALTDDSATKLLAAGPLNSVESVTTGNVFTLTALDIEFPDPA